MILTLVNPKLYGNITDYYTRLISLLEVENKYLNKEKQKSFKENIFK